MAVTQVYTSSKKTLLALQDLHDQLNNITAVLNRFDRLVESGDLDAIEDGDLKTIYKDTIKVMVDKTVSQYLAEAAIEAAASEAEASDKIKGMAPVIAGIPVIIPPPADFLALVTGFLALGVEASADLTTLLNDISAVTN